MDDLMKNNSQKGQLVTFLLGQETYGIDIFKIQEVLHYRDVTTIPNAPTFVEGVIQVRDRLIPVVDLKAKLGIDDTGQSKKRILILDLGRQYLGVVVDDISKVLMLSDSCYEDLPDAVIKDPERECVTSVAKVDDQLVIIIYPERILTSGQMQALQDINQTLLEELANDASADQSA